MSNNIKPLISGGMVCKVGKSDACEKRFRSDHSKGLFSQDDIEVILAWISEMEKLGPDYIATSPDWRDHKLDRKWEGYRASCYSSSGRIIYKIIDNIITITEIKIERVTPDHNYEGGPSEKK